MKEASPPCNAAMVGILVRLLKVIITITMRQHKVTDNYVSSVSTSPIALIFTPIFDKLQLLLFPPRNFANFAPFSP